MRVLVAVLVALALAIPCGAVNIEELKGALPGDAAGILNGIEELDVGHGLAALAKEGAARLRRGLWDSVRSAFLMTAVCLLVSLVQSFAKQSGVSMPEKVVELAGATAILRLAFGESGALLELCRDAVTDLDRFTKVLCGVFAAASAAAGKPASAVATAGAAMLFSDLLFQLVLKVFLPAISLYLLLIYGGVIGDSGTLRQAAVVEKWAVSNFFRVFLTMYFAYLAFTGLMTGAADAAAVKTAQSLSSTVPLVGSVIAGASEAILSGAAILRSSVGMVGFLGTLAICLTPLVKGLCHMITFKILSVVASSFSEGGCRTMMNGLADAYSMLMGILIACCAVQFITIVVSMLVTGT